MVSTGTMVLNLLMMPMSLAMATMRQSTVLAAPRLVCAESVTASPTLTLSRSTCDSNSIIVLGSAKSSMRPLTTLITRLKSDSLLISIPVTPA